MGVITSVCIDSLCSNNPLGQAGVMDASLARRLWRVGEPVHAIVYFHPASTDAWAAAGLRGFWRGYFATRAAPFGAVGPGPVTATFYNFHPAMVAKALPEVWTMASPDEALAARLAGADAALRAVLRPDADPRRHRDDRRRAADRARDGLPSGGAGAVRRQHHAPLARGTTARAVAQPHVAARAPRRRAQRSPGRRGHRWLRRPRPRGGAVGGSPA